MQIGLSEPDTVQIKGGGYLILDFGREQSGGIRILTHGANGDKRVRLRFGESLSETCAELGEKNATNDHSNRDFTVELQNYSDMTFGNTGFRFVRLDFLGKDSGFGIKSIVAASDEDEREEVGRFECDDPRDKRNLEHGVADAEAVPAQRLFLGRSKAGPSGVDRGFISRNAKLVLPV